MFLQVMQCLASHHLHCSIPELFILWIYQLLWRGLEYFWVFWRPLPVVLGSFYMTSVVFVSAAYVHGWYYSYYVDTTHKYHNMITGREYIIFWNVESVGYNTSVKLQPLNKPEWPYVYTRIASQSTSFIWQQECRSFCKNLK